MTLRPRNVKLSTAENRGTARVALRGLPRLVTAPRDV